MLLEMPVILEATTKEDSEFIADDNYVDLTKCEYGIEVENELIVNNEK